MVYTLFVQESGNDTVSTTKFSVKDFYVVQKGIAEQCDGYGISEREYKKLIKGQNLVVKASGKIFELALA